MSNHTASKDSIDAMHANDSKQAEHAKHPGADEKHAPEAHTKAAGDQRNVIDKEETTSAYRGEFNRGH